MNPYSVLAIIERATSAAERVVSIGTKVVGLFRKKPPPPSSPLTWKDVEHQQRQIAAGARKFPKPPGR